MSTWASLLTKQKTYEITELLPETEYTVSINGIYNEPIEVWLTTLITDENGIVETEVNQDNAVYVGDLENNKLTFTAQEVHTALVIRPLGDSELNTIQLEKGNTAADWTPAPEDVQANIDDLDNRVTNNINQTANQIRTEVSESRAVFFSDVPPEDISRLWLDISDNILKQFMAVDEDGEQVEGWYPVTYHAEKTLDARLDITNNAISAEVGAREELEGVLRSEISTEVSHLSDSVTTTITNLAQGLDATESEISEIKTYFRISEEGILLGKSDNPIEFYAEPDEVGFRENGVRIAYWKEGTMHVDNLIAIMTIVVGYHQIEKYDSPIAGKTSVIRRGGEA